MPEQAEALAKLSMKSGLTGREGENVELSTTRINQIVTDIINQEP
jgi:hypothetical protein